MLSKQEARQRAANGKNPGTKAGRINEYCNRQIRELKSSISGVTRFVHTEEATSLPLWLQTWTSRRTGWSTPWRSTPQPARTTRASSRWSSSHSYAADSGWLLLRPGQFSPLGGHGGLGQHPAGRLLQRLESWPSSSRRGTSSSGGTSPPQPGPAWRIQWPVGTVTSRTKAARQATSSGASRTSLGTGRPTPQLDGRSSSAKTASPSSSGRRCRFQRPSLTERLFSRGTFSRNKNG